MVSFTALALTGLVSLAAAQNTTAGTYYINPDSVSSSTRGKSGSVTLGDPAR